MMFNSRIWRHLQEDEFHFESVSSHHFFLILSFKSRDFALHYSQTPVQLLGGNALSYTNQTEPNTED